MKVIISAERKELNNDDNFERSKRLRALLVTWFSVFNIKACVGTFQGSKEVSFLITGVESGDLQFLHDIKEEFNQLCFLLSFDNGDTFLEYDENSSQYIGKLNMVQTLPKKGDYTSLLNGNYLIVA